MSLAKILVIAVCLSVTAGFAFDKELIGTPWGAGLAGFACVMVAAFSWMNGNS